MKKLPIALVVGLVLEACFGVVRLVHLEMVSDLSEAAFARWGIIEACFDFANAALICAGLFQVATGLRGNQAIGARIAGFAFALELAISVAWSLATSYQSPSWIETLVHVLDYLHPIAYLAAALGMIVATRKLGLGIAAAVIVAVLIPVPPLEQAIRAHVSFGRTLGYLMIALPYILLALGWLAMFATTEVEMPPPQVQADAAFSSAARSIWIRVIAACSIAGITFFAALSGEAGLLGLLRGVTILSPLVDAIALGLLARATLQLVRARIAPGLTMASAVFALLATGGVLNQVPTLYRMLYAEHSYGLGDDSAGLWLYSIAIPLFATAALTLVAMAVVRLARERNAEDVRENVAIRIGVYIVLALGTLFVSTYGATHLPNSRGVVLFVLLALVVAAFYSLVLIAKICATGAELVARDPVGLPTAKVL
jgi:hypothetical protein